MAQCSQSAGEFIQSAFCPTIAVMCSEDAETACEKNNLSFVELMRPFCQLTTEGRTCLGFICTLDGEGYRITVICSVLVLSPRFYQ